MNLVNTPKKLFGTIVTVGVLPAAGIGAIWSLVLQTENVAPSHPNVVSDTQQESGQGIIGDKEIKIRVTPQPIPAPNYVTPSRKAVVETPHEQVPSVQSKVAADEPDPRPTLDTRTGSEGGLASPDPGSPKPKDDQAPTTPNDQSKGRVESVPTKPAGAPQ
jgi:hypothetical protein